MRELDCDFCGGPAVGAYEVLPEDLEPTSAEQVRVVLCDDCRATLDGVLAPLLARLGVGGGAGGPPGSPSFAADAAGHGRPDETTVTPRRDRGAGGRILDDRESGGDDRETAANDRDSGVTDTATGDPETGDTATADTAIADAATGETGTARSATAGEAESAGKTESAERAAFAGDAESSEESGNGSDAEAVDETSSASASSEVNGVTVDDTDDADSGPGSGDDGTAASEEPENFRRVMRLLNNREFPVERAAVTELASGAYDMEDHEVDDVIDYAVERGVLAEENGRLRKG